MAIQVEAEAKNIVSINPEATPDEAVRFFLSFMNGWPTVEVVKKDVKPLEDNRPFLRKVRDYFNTVIRDGREFF